MKKRRLTNLVLAFMSLVCLLLSFPPADMGSLIFIAFVPWLVLAGRERPRTVAFYSLLIGVVFFVASVSWLRFISAASWLSLSLALAVFFCIFGAAASYLHRRFGLPLTLVAPVAWVAQEYFRSFFLTGFPWFYAGHALYKNLTLIQLADTTGVYGISFVVVSCNALIADFFLFLERKDSAVRMVGLTVWTGMLLAATVIHGRTRLAEYWRIEGPLICLVQGSVPQDLKNEESLRASVKILDDYRRISLLAEGKEKDLVVWPETMVPGFINFAFLKERDDCYHELLEMSDKGLDALKELARRLDAPLLVGCQRAEKKNGEWLRRNTAELFDLDYYEKHGEIRTTYSKIHLVPFGEYVPFKKTFPFLKKMVPYEVGFIPGSDTTVFTLKGRRFGVLICYEDTIPPLVRRFKREKDVDFMINISNDGWFSGSAELDEHLAVSVFRAVENRIGLARAANTGISSFIAPTGEIEAVVSQNGCHKEVEGVLIRHVSLDDRRTFYTRWGDLVGMICLGVFVLSVWPGGLRELVPGMDGTLKKM